MAKPNIKPAQAEVPNPAPTQREELFCLVLGGWLALALLKFGNPVILDPLIERPQGLLELIYQSWPTLWGYTFFALVLVLGLRLLRFQPRVSPWFFVCPAAWLAWQFMVSTQSVEPKLTGLVIPHLCVLVLVYYLGVFGLARMPRLFLFWLPLGTALGLSIWVGLNQHFGGLDETIKMVQQQPGWENLPPEYLQRMMGKRIFSTLVYPNAFAGALILLAPVVAALLWQIRSQTVWLGRGLALVLLGLGLACLVWTKSKSGWLIVSLLLLVWLWTLNLKASHRRMLVGAVAVVAIGAFAWRFSGYFAKGATSAAARMDYWRAAGQIIAHNPVVGTGPGTFGPEYKKIKPPAAEMAHLAHNDYLEQATDSGVLGFVLYLGWVGGSFYLLYRYRLVELTQKALVFGVLGWFLHGFVEFGLYIPGTAWVAMTLLGLAVGRAISGNAIDKGPSGT